MSDTKSARVTRIIWKAALLFLVLNFLALIGFAKGGSISVFTLLGLIALNTILYVAVKCVTVQILRVEELLEKSDCSGGNGGEP